MSDAPRCGLALLRDLGRLGRAVGVYDWQVWTVPTQVLRPGHVVYDADAGTLGMSVGTAPTMTRVSGRYLVPFKERE